MSENTLPPRGYQVVGQNVMDITKYGHRERRDIRLKKYNKLVRDKIPEIIEQDGRKAVCHVLSEMDYIVKLDKKLSEVVWESF